ncbi:MAG: PfkB family carbohydrate kinase [Bacteroidales bacterium]|jgi:fructokinase|nr:PfkB family carbohydrate kinase [Bacteroidales bacterium]
MSRRVFAIGETVFDIIFKDGKPVASTPGGSMLNTAVSLGRLGLDVHFISEYGKDTVGNLVNDFLRSNGVDTGDACRYDGFPSSLALAFLNRDNNAEYSFYKHYPEKRLDVTFPELTGDDIVIYGSFYGIEPDIYVRLKPFLEQAHAKNALVIYDPNFRKAHLSGMDIYRPIMMENFAHADIVKGSNEDFENIFGARTAAESWQHLGGDCSMLIYTANSNCVELCMTDVHDSYPVPPITPVSTIGAGDTFNAGLIFSLVTQGIGKAGLKHLDAGQRADIVRSAIKLAGHVCMSYDNYISPEFAEKLSAEN